MLSDDDEIFRALSRSLSLSHVRSLSVDRSVAIPLIALARSLTTSLLVFLPHARALAVAAVPATAEHSCQHTFQRDVFVFNGLYIRVRSL